MAGKKTGNQTVNVDDLDINDIEARMKKISREGAEKFGSTPRKVTEKKTESKPKKKTKKDA